MANIERLLIGERLKQLVMWKKMIERCASLCSPITLAMKHLGLLGELQMLPLARYSWAFRQENAQDIVGVPSSSFSQAASSRGSTMRGKNIVRSRGPGFPGPSSPGGCGLGRRIYVFCKISQGWTTIVSFFFNSTLRTYHWVSFRCSGNICCCVSTGIQCKAQSLSAWCGRWRLWRNIGVKKL